MTDKERLGKGHRWEEAQENLQLDAVWAPAPDPGTQTDTGERLVNLKERAVLEVLLLLLITQSCLTLCTPLDSSTHLPEFAQAHVHQVGDAIQPSRPLLSPSPPAFNLFQHVFSSELGLHLRWPKYWSFSFSISPIFRVGFL